MLENHARHLRDYAHRYGFGLSIEPYDMSPNNDIALGGIADVPMGETWEVDDVFNTAFSCIEAVSAARINNRPIVGAESVHQFAFRQGQILETPSGNMKTKQTGRSASASTAWYSTVMPTSRGRTSGPE